MNSLMIPNIIIENKYSVAIHEVMTLPEHAYSGKSGSVNASLTQSNSGSFVLVTVVVEPKVVLIRLLDEGLVTVSFSKARVTSISCE